MLVFLVGTECVKRLDAKNAHNSTENVSLLEINIYQFCRFILNVLNRFADMRDLELRRQGN